MTGRSMRRSLLLTGALALFAATGCAQWQGEVAARVGDTEITMEQIEADVAGLSAAPEAQQVLLGAVKESAPGRLDAESARWITQNRLITVLQERELGRRSQSIGDADLAAAEASLNQQLSSGGVAPTAIPQRVRETLIRSEAGRTKLQSAFAATMVERDPEGFSPVCVAVASTSSEALAADLIAEASDTASLERAVAGTNNEANFDDSTCIAPRVIGLPEIKTAIEEAKEGDVLGPLDNGQGAYFVIIVGERQGPDIASALLVEQQSGDEWSKWLALAMTSEDVAVSPRIGAIDATSGRLIALSSPKRP